MRTQWWLIVGLLLLVSACAPAQPGSLPDGPETVPAPVPQVDLNSLPAVELQADPLVLRYPEQRLYRPGAALPTPEGLAALQALGKWLAQAESGTWQAQLWNAVGATEADQEALVGKRVELLQRLFARQGLGNVTLRWDGTVGVGPDLELQPVNASAQP